MDAPIARQLLMIFAALLILSSFGLHLVELQHDHPHALFGNTAQAVFHGEDRKWAVPAILREPSASMFSLLVLLMMISVMRSHKSERHRLNNARSRDVIKQAFQCGILNPKLY